MSELEVRGKIQSALKEFSNGNLSQNATAFFETLGYKSERCFPQSSYSSEEFLAVFDGAGIVNPVKALASEWATICPLFQITADEVKASSQLALDFGKAKQFDKGRIESYLFFAIDLAGSHYTRGRLAAATRDLNKLFPMPVMILFRHGSSLTFSIIDRRLNKKDESKDVLEKVTLVKDITYAEPLRAHVEILYDLSLDALYEEFYFHNFYGLHQAWAKRLDSYALHERFYREVADWYFWALQAPGVVLPRSIQEIRDQDERDKQRSMFFIRLLTRLIFCWFLQEKGFLPRDLFRRRVVDNLLKDTSPEAGSYYKAFLQNLFFATLNNERELRDWRKKYQSSRDGNRGVSSLWRYKDLLASPDQLEVLLKDQIPFVNGGLFDCLDDVRDGKTPSVRLDDFSEEKDNGLCLPNDLFFGEERSVDLSGVYDDQRRKKENVRGLIEILSRYKFTVEENTPLEQEIALDPELLGKVFENLLASYNEDTRTTARKALGAFYTPREIVNYMVDQALVSYLASQVPSVSQATLRSLLISETKTSDLSPLEKAAIVKAIGSVKILDPACGSGAFPMGALHRLVDLLQKLDPNNEGWKQDRLAEAERYLDLVRQANAPRSELAEVEARIEDIRRSFDTRFHALDFARKLYLIENCIYGVDIQPIACLIAKLRFFIALIVDQRMDPQAPNLGVRPLPNLETKIVAADTTVGVRQHGQQALRSVEIDAKEADLQRVRERYFLARTPETKAKYREQDARLRVTIAELLKGTGWDIATAQKLASWDPYDQNHAAPFFDSEWMFGLPVGKVMTTDAPTASMLGRLSLVSAAGGETELSSTSEIDSGFDIVIGNPPYVRIQTLKKKEPGLVDSYKRDYESAKRGNYDLYVVFVEAGLKFLKPNGHLAYILPHKFFNAQYGEPLRLLLSKGRHLRHVVHFGDHQVFPGASNYVCLLFLSKAGTPSCRFVRVDDLTTWLGTLSGTERVFPAETVTSAEWNFPVGSGSGVFEDLAARPSKLGELASIFVGLQTSGDRIYVLDGVADPGGGLVRVKAHDGKERSLERSLLKPFLDDVSSGPYGLPHSSRWLIFPYVLSAQGSRLVTSAELDKDYSRLWSYLKEHETELRSRDNGRADGPEWHGYVYRKNLRLFEAPKLIVQVLAQQPRFAFDDRGIYFAGGGNAGYYGVRWNAGSSTSIHYLQAILNSPVSYYYLRHISTTFRGGYWSYAKRYIEHIPIASATARQERLVVRVVEDLLWLNRFRSEDLARQNARDTILLGYWEQIVNGLVYELYFPEQLHARGLSLFEAVQKAGVIPSEDTPGPLRLDHLRREFERVYDLHHPVRAALHDLQTVEVVRIIEGKA